MIIFVSLRASHRGSQLLAKAAADVWTAIEAGNQAALDYLQREAGYTRSGYYGRQVDGITTGHWEDAHRFIIGSFPRHRRSPRW